MNIFVVDDSAAMRMMVVRALRQAGHSGKQITQAEDGQIAYDKITGDMANIPDLILADWNMPNMTGIELLHALNEKEIKTNFGFITTESTREMRQAATDAGANFLIAKPFTADSIERALDSLS
ncbi:MAG: response regulator [Pseudomonadales bacterium]